MKRFAFDWLRFACGAPSKDSSQNRQDIGKQAKVESLLDGHALAG
jgi:hypothetical protein